MVSFVYFDVGGVVIADVNGTDKWEEMKRSIGIRMKDNEEFDRFYSKYEKEACVGRDIDTLIPLIAKKFHVNFPAGYSLLSDFINRFERNKFIWPVIEKIRQDSQIGLLTNMYPGMFSAIVKKGIMPEAIWNVIVDSSIEGCLKPGFKIFELALEKANVEKGNILFVDNKIKNTNAGKKFGWKTFFYDSSDHENSSQGLLNYYEKISK